MVIFGYSNVFFVVIVVVELEFYLLGVWVFKFRMKLRRIVIFVVV